MRISVVGLGKLGSPMAAVLAAKGHTVVGADLNPQFVAAINAGKAPVFEPGLDEMLARSGGRLSATTDVKAAVAATDATFIIVGTPSDANGSFSLRYALPVCESIGRALAEKGSYHVVTMTSTVMPGATGGALRAALEKASGKTAGKDFGLCYNPEFIALGTVIRDMLNPDFVLIGESDPRAGELLESIHKATIDKPAPVARMNFVNAELTKLAVNTYVTTKISYANMLSDVCSRLPGADVDVVTGALGMDTRIGKKYLKGALGFGGPCFPRDNRAFVHLATMAGAQPILAEATDRVNRLQAPRLAEMVLSRLPKDGTVAVLGLSYKPATNVVEESQGVELAKYLLGKGVRTSVYDPAATENARGLLHGPVNFPASLTEAVRSADVVVITTPWEDFKLLTPAMLNRERGRPTVIDCWRLLSRETFEAAADYLSLGTGPAEESAALRREAAAAGR